MKHEEYREKLSALLDEELDEREKAEVLAHLNVCEACQTYLIELTAVHNALSRMDTPSVPEGFAAGVMARLHENEPEKSIESVNNGENDPKTTARRRNRRMIASVAAAAAVLAIISVPRMFRMGSSAEMSAPSVQNSAVYGASGSTSSAAAEVYTADTTADSAAPEAPMLAESKQALDGGTPAAGAAMAELMEEAPAEFTTNTAAPETAYDAAMDALPEEESRKELPVLTLGGEGAAEWLAKHGEALGDGCWLVSVEDVNALPDTLELIAEDDVQRPTDGMLIITLGTAEERP